MYLIIIWVFNNLFIFNYFIIIFFLCLELDLIKLFITHIFLLKWSIQKYVSLFMILKLWDNCKYSNYYYYTNRSENVIVDQQNNKIIKQNRRKNIKQFEGSIFCWYYWHGYCINFRLWKSLTWISKINKNKAVLDFWSSAKISNNW